jgi:hypothetical protein
MPPRQSEQCSCTFRSGCLIMQQTEKAEGSCFVRIWVRGRHARDVLLNILHIEGPRFHQQYAPISDSGTMYATVGGWCTLLCGRELKPAREIVAWTKPDLDRLRAIYEAEGMAGCVRAFEGRSYSSLACALRRHKMTAGRRRSEALAG